MLKNFTVCEYFDTSKRQYIKDREYSTLSNCSLLNPATKKSVFEQITCVIACSAHTNC